VRTLSLRSRLLLGVVVLAGLGLVAADIATYDSLGSFLIGRVDAGLEAGHRAFEHAPPGAKPKPDHDTGDHQGPPPQGVDWYEVRTLSGRVLRQGRLVEGSSAPRLPAKVTLPARPNGGDEYVSFFSVPARNGEDSYRVRASIEPDRPRQILFVASSLAGLDGTLHRLLVIEAIATVAVLVALGLVAAWLVRLGLRPLRGIEATAAAIAGGDLSQRVDHPDPRTEVGRVGSVLNVMLDRIEASDRRLRRFIADASHELRTPLASVRAYAELFARGAASRPADLERAMTGITREAERMSLLVEDLLLLARLDEGRPLASDPVSLDAVVAEAVDAAEILDSSRRYALEAENVVVEGDGEKLRQIVDNLLANARSHTPAATEVKVSVRRDGDEAVLEVTDSGPGLSEEDAQRIFERFYRADESRARAEGGVGLGLAIVAAVAHAHGGSAEVRSEPGHGATFAVRLPLA
jgi:two-component system OmpR family sensor kinase